MQNIPYNECYRPASLLDRENLILSSGTVCLDTVKCQAEFFPSETENGDTLLKRASILRMKDGPPYAIQSIVPCPVTGKGVHYEIEIAPTS